MTKNCILKILQNSVRKNSNVLAHVCLQKVWLSLPLAAVGFPTKKGVSTPTGGFADILFGKILAKMHKIKEIESRGGVSSAPLDTPMFAISDSQSFFSIPPFGIRGESKPIDVIHLAPFHRFKAMAKDVDYCREVNLKVPLRSWVVSTMIQGPEHRHSSVLFVELLFSLGSRLRHGLADHRVLQPVQPEVLRRCFHPPPQNVQRVQRLPRFQRLGPRPG